MTPKSISFTCPSCGASVLYTNKFCSYCGTQFDDSEPKILTETEEDINRYVLTVISHVKKRFLWMKITYTKQLSKISQKEW